MKVNFLAGLEKGMDYLHQRGAFLTVKESGKANTMTISWGSVGFMWQKPIFITMVRKSRYTFELIENANDFTISIPYGPKMKEALAICGSKSGRDIDKCLVADISFKNSTMVESPIINGCNLYYECRIVYKQAMEKELLVPDIQKSMYATDDYHTLYYGEIVACYEKEANGV